jgi:tRNA pseudouridine38-40 synthase
MKKNFKLTIEYDGTSYHGWQRQRKTPTIQEEIEKALLMMTGKTIVLQGSGRTDAGVHALAQTANFLCETALDESAFQNGLNSLLPDDIVIKDCNQVDESFHARYDAKSKIYQYRILNRKIPAAINRQYAWLIRKSLRIDDMRRAIRHLIGRQNFKAFEGTGSPKSHTTRSVLKATVWQSEQDLLFFEIEADGFLRFMVRNIIGTLVEVGLGKITCDQFKEILQSKDRSRAGPTAPAHGLFLKEVRYR